MFAGIFGSLVGVGGGVIITPMIVNICKTIPQRCEYLQRTILGCGCDTTRLLELVLAMVLVVLVVAVVAVCESMLLV